MNISVVIATRNRRDLVSRAVGSAFAQTIAAEVLVLDDASSDGTPDAIGTEFPEAVVHRADRQQGCVAQRNLGARLAQGDTVVFLDDDATFSSRETLAEAVADLDAPRVGAVAIPLLDARYPGEIWWRAPDRAGIWVAPAFSGGASAVDRAIFLRLGGFRPELRYQGEEAEFALRMLDAGRVVRLGRGSHVFHEPPQPVDRCDVHRQNARNDVVVAFLDVPMPFLVPRLARASAKAAYLAFARRCVRQTLGGLRLGWRDGFATLSARRPVSHAAYRLNRRLRRRGVVSLDSIAPKLERMAGTG